MPSASRPIALTTITSPLVEASTTVSEHTSPGWGTPIALNPLARRLINPRLVTEPPPSHGLIPNALTHNLFEEEEEVCAGWRRRGRPALTGLYCPSPPAEEAVTRIFNG